MDNESAYVPPGPEEVCVSLLTSLIGLDWIGLYVQSVRGRKQKMSCTGGFIQAGNGCTDFKGF